MMTFKGINAATTDLLMERVEVLKVTLQYTILQKPDVAGH
jgi:hypothetical protein